MRENHPICKTKVLSDGSRVIKSTTTTAGPVTTTTIVHLKNIPAKDVSVEDRLSPHTRACPDDYIEPTIELGDNNDDTPEFNQGLQYTKANPDDYVKIELADENDDAPMPPQTMEVLFEVTEQEDPNKILQGAKNERDNITAKISRRMRLPKNRRVAPSPLSVGVDQGTDSVAREQTNAAILEGAGNDEEELAVATPVRDEPVYTVSKYPEVRVLFYKRGRYILSTFVALAVIR